MQIRGVPETNQMKISRTNHHVCKRYCELFEMIYMGLDQ